MAADPPSSSRRLKRNLRKAGLSNSAIAAAWPSWWSPTAESSSSAHAELRFALARKLGLSAPALLADIVDFIWRDEARFKCVLADSEETHSALASFTVSVGRLILQATKDVGTQFVSALYLRTAILENSHVVDLQSLLATCWAIGIPVAHLRIFPVESHKGMHAVAVRTEHRFAILLSRDAQYPAPIAFDLAHELGHIMLGHLANAAVLIDEADVAAEKPPQNNDDQELAANRFALELLTGSPAPEIIATMAKFSGRQLARATLAAAVSRRIEPGTLAMCTAFQTQQWAASAVALKEIYGEAKPVWKEVNGWANKEIDWDAIGDDSAEYLRTILGAESVR